MKELLCNSTFFCTMLSILAYELGVILKRKFKLAIFNPLLVGLIVVIIVLVAFNVDYDSFYSGAKYLGYLLTPATVCLAIPLYEQFEQLKNHWKAIMAGIVAGVITSLLCIFALALLFDIGHEDYVALLPKSITMAIGLGVSQELQGTIIITIATIMITGVFGNIIAETICKLFKIEEPIAKGVGIGTASHAIGTAKALEMGELEGAMSGLAIVVAGLLTVIGAGIFANFI